MKQNMDNSRNTGTTIQYHMYFECEMKICRGNCSLKLPFWFPNETAILSESASLHTNNGLSARLAGCKMQLVAKF